MVVCREEDEPFIRNAISRDKSVHETIVRRPAHPRRLVGVLVIGRVAAKPCLAPKGHSGASRHHWALAMRALRPPRSIAS
jgi:hypothetical protein